eukprot:5211626-Alexandrium_andersonii.AAC.1
MCIRDSRGAARRREVRAQGKRAAEARAARWAAAEGSRDASAGPRTRMRGKRPAAKAWTTADGEVGYPGRAFR